MNSARWSAPTHRRPVVRNRSSCSPVLAPSRPFISNSRRSKFDGTWMSIDGLRVGTTGRVLMSLSSMNRVTMSLVFDETTKSRIGAPICRAIQPASTLPKFPVGTLNDTGVPNVSAATT